MKNIAELARFVRFQLSQLKAQNKHHEFEHLCRHFARLRLCDRILPATGPVGSGGDQGRDFESYQTYLAGKGLGTSSFMGLGQDKRLVFACSLQDKIQQKIRADVTTICSGPNPVDVIYFFTEADIPVGARHILQKWARDTFNVELEIFDGQALSELLSSADVFWIAEEYLSVPADYYPQPRESESRYERNRSHWFLEEQVPTNYADFFEIKYGLRCATFEEKLKPDLSRWIKLIEQFAVPGSSIQLKRKASYEIAVAALRGQNNVDKYAPLVDEYFSSIDSLQDPADLVDACTLLSYCSSARCVGHSTRDPGQLHDWRIRLVRRFMKKLDASYKEGLPDKTFSVRPYAELYAEAISKAMYDKTKRGSVRPPWYGRKFAHVVPQEMSWIDIPGPGYSKVKAQQFIQNRYRNAIRPIRNSLVKLLENSDFRTAIRAMREEGYRDWHILLVISNVIVQHRMESRFGSKADSRELSKETMKEMWRDEPADSEVPSMKLFSREVIDLRKKFTWVTIGKTWGLEAPRRTPDFDALKRMLITRYGCGVDDVEHEDLFPEI